MYVKGSDLCNNPVDPYDSASTAYVMLKPSSQGAFGAWYQIGYVRRGWEADTCGVYYMQYADGAGNYSTNHATTCPSTATWYRFVLKWHYGNPDEYWTAYALLDSTGQTTWQAWTTVFLDWVPEYGEYSSEIFNDARDQSGGGSVSRLTFDNIGYWLADWTNQYANMTGSERFCELCGSYGPYNTQWDDGNTFEVWTDGFN